MPRGMNIGDNVSLKPGTTSYRHFIKYMPVDGILIDYNITHMVGRVCRPYKVRFLDKRESWYSRDELVKREGPLTSGGFPG